MRSDILGLSAEEISTKKQAAERQNAAKNIIGQVAAVGHHGRAGDRRTERANDGHKPGHNHRLAAVFFIELVSALQMALAKHERILTPIKRLSRLPAYPIANLVPHDRAQGN